MLVKLLLIRLLFANILADSRLIKTYGTHTVTACPKVIATQIFASAQIPTMDQYRRFAFQPPYRLRYRVTWRNTQTHVDMIRTCMALYQFYAKLLA